jgi:dCMP deaminase
MSRLWDARFLDLAAKIASWSKDPSTSCGAVIVDPQRRVVSTGYNGFPAGIDDAPDKLADRDTKLSMTLHAEHNAILFAQRDLAGCTLYVWPMPPCAHCAAQIAQVGIARVVSGRPTPEQSDRWGESFRLAQWVFGQRGIAYEVA